MTKGKKNFEVILAELESIVEQLEGDNIPLEESLKKFEKGVELYKECKSLLSDVEKKIKILAENLEEEFQD